MGKIVKYDRRRFKRLLLLLPLTLLIMLVVLFFIERSRIIDKKFSVGYEGPMKFVPEVRILDESDLGKEDDFTERYEPMVSKEVVTPEESRQSRTEREDSSPVEKELSLPDEISIDSERFYRTYPSRAEVPYSREYIIEEMVEPEYPADALENGIEGYVIVEVQVAPNGKVHSAYARKVFGAESFAKASLDAVRRFRFKPKLKNGKPVTFWVSFLIRFTFNARR